MNFLQLFRYSTTAQKPAYMPDDLISNKEVLCPPHVFPFLKYSVLTLLDRIV
jgi:hypothetical protein